MLEYDVKRQGFKRTRENPIPADMVIIDEASMIDQRLMYSLMAAIDNTCRIILVGDAEQLPSVGPGNVLEDIIASQAVPVIRLSRIFRQSQRSRIVISAHHIVRGSMPELRSSAAGVDETDFFFIRQRDELVIQNTIADLVSNRIPGKFGFDPLTDIQVLTPMHRGALGTEELNSVLRERSNPLAVGGDTIGLGFGVGDRVIQLQNNYEREVFNGDIGVATVINRDTENFSVQFGDRTVWYDFSDSEKLVLAYAITIHKSQGSEYPAVVVPVVSQHYVMPRRNLLYTAVTRAKKLLVMVGDPRAVRIAVQRTDTGAAIRIWPRGSSG